MSNSTESRLDALKEEEASILANQKMGGWVPPEDLVRLHRVQRQIAMLSEDKRK